MRYLIILSFFIFTGCSSTHLPGWLQVQQIDINQGNIIEEEKLAQLKVGMNKVEVKSLLGTPMLKNNFHANRWDYIYYSKPAKQAVMQKSVSLFFENNKLINIKADNEQNPTLL